MRRTLIVSLLVVAATICQSAIAGQPPSNLKWSAVASMLEARLGHAMVELPAGPSGLGLSAGGGKVMVIGGFDSEPLASRTFRQTRSPTLSLASRGSWIFGAVPR